MINLLPYLPQFYHGLGLTLVLMLASLSLGLLLAVLMTLGSLSGNRFIKTTIQSLIFFIRGTPLLVQIFLLYFGFGQFAIMRESWLWPLLRDPTVCAVIALSINTACYTTVLLLGAIASVPRNQIAACYALGMGKWLALRRIILPLAGRLALPAYSNEVLMILKGTSLASTITLLDLMGVAQRVISETYATVEVYLLTAVFYIFINGLLIIFFRSLERRFAAQP